MSNAYQLTKGVHTRWEAGEGRDTRDEGGRRPGKHVVYKAGVRDVMRNLTPAEIRRLEGRIKQVSASPPAVQEAPASPADPEPVSDPEPEAEESGAETEEKPFRPSDLPWQTVKAKVAEMDDPDEVQAIRAAELAGRARQSILDACAARLGELA